VATELGGTQVASLLETLPGIASVLRNPVADAFVGLIRAGARLGEFKLADAEEILRYAVRRKLMTQEMRAEGGEECERYKGKKPPLVAVPRQKIRPAAKKPAKPT
jgi:hypothetical protein